MTGINPKVITKMFANEARRFFRSSRLIVYLIMLAFLYILVIQPLKECALLMDGKLSLIEPFIAIGSSKVSMLAIPILYIVLIADFPWQGKDMYYVHIRTTKTSWVVSETILGAFSSISALVAVLIGSIIMSLGSCEFAFDFSYPVTCFLSKYPEKEGVLIVNLLPGNLYNQMTAINACMHMLLLTTLYLWILSQIIVLFTEINKKKAGIAIAVLLVVMGSAAEIAESKSKWLFPTAHTITWGHFTEYSRAPIVKLSTSYCYLSCLLLLLIVLSLAARKKYEVRG